MVAIEASTNYVYQYSSSATSGKAISNVVTASAIYATASGKATLIKWVSTSGSTAEVLMGFSDGSHFRANIPTIGSAAVNIDVTYTKMNGAIGDIVYVGDTSPTKIVAGDATGYIQVSNYATNAKICTYQIPHYTGVAQAVNTIIYLNAITTSVTTNYVLVGTTTGKTIEVSHVDCSVRRTWTQTAAV